MSRLALIGGLWCQLALMAALVLCAGPAFATDTVYYYLSDALHSEVVVTDQNRNVVERTYYAPYGQVLSRSLRDGPGYAGAEEDPGTGLDYMQQRYYDPQTGRFISTDPMAVSPAGGNFNRYAYANDNPYRYTDPTGMCTGSHISNSDGTCASAGDFTTQASNAHLVGASAAQRGTILGIHGSTHVNDETYKQYLGNLAAKGINGSNTSVPAKTKEEINNVTSSQEFWNPAIGLYLRDVVLGRETGGIQVYKAGPDKINIVPYVGGPAICPAAAACMSAPAPDSREGRIFFEWHPHPISGPGAVLPSENDLERANYYHIPSVIWANTGSIFPTQIDYQANCLATGCQ